MKMLPTPFGGMFPGMTVEYGEEALTAYRIKVNYKGVCVLHSPPASFVFRYAKRESGVVCRDTVENLDT